VSAHLSSLSSTPGLPLEIDTYPEDVRERLLQALAAVLAMEPLPPHVVGHEHLGTHPLPAGMPKLVALHGKKRCGKTSMAEFLEERYQGVVQLGFSAPMIVETNEYLAPFGHVIDDVNKADPRYRFLLQMWAEARRVEDPNYWVGPLSQACQAALETGARLILMPGLRELLEKDTVEALGGEVWKIVNPNLPPEDEARQHPIETALDHLPDEAFAKVLVNDAPNLLEWCRVVDVVIKQY
jgi:hypothetical protein